MDAVQAMGTYQQSLEAFGNSALELTTQLDIGFDQASAKLDALYDHCKHEMSRLTEAFGRRPWSVSDQIELRRAADHSMTTLDELKQQFRSAIATMHMKE